MSWRIVNVVSTADLDQRVDIWEAAELPYTIHDIEIYGGRVTYLKTPEMYGKTTIFTSGKLISVGTKSPEQAINDLEDTHDYLADNKIITPTKIEPRLRNLVATLTLEHPIDLEGLADEISALYEPEQFPSAIIKTDSVDATFLVFASGKIVMSGLKNIRNLEKANKIITEIVQDYYIK